MEGRARVSKGGNDVGGLQAGGSGAGASLSPTHRFLRADGVSDVAVAELLDRDVVDREQLVPNLQHPLKTCSDRMSHARTRRAHQSASNTHGRQSQNQCTG